MADGTGGGLLIGAILAVAGGRFLWRLARFPVRVCPDCKGVGKILAPGGKRLRDCKRCGMSGELR